MDYLLDTDLCIDAIKNRVPTVRVRLADALQRGDHLFVPAIASFELWYGVAKSGIPEANASLVSAFLSGVTGLLPFDEEDARAAGSIRANLEKSGKLIGAYDLLIAGQALRNGMTLVTANVREFSRVDGLQWQNWAKP